jgi:hypothetical protein
MMRVRRKWYVLYLLLILVVPNSAFCGPNDQGNQGKQDGSSAAFPKAHVPEPNYEFQPVVEGENVIHDFVVQNKGTATLDITRVRPG